MDQFLRGPVKLAHWIRTLGLREAYYEFHSFFWASWFPSPLNKLQNSPKFPSCALLQIQFAKSSEVYHCYTGHKFLCLFCKEVKVYFTTYNLCDNLIFGNELWTWVLNTLQQLKPNKFARLVGSKFGFFIVVNNEKSGLSLEKI